MLLSSLGVSYLKAKWQEQEMLFRHLGYAFSLFVVYTLGKILYYFNL